MQPFECVDEFLREDTDVIVYSGTISREGYQKFCDVLRAKPRRQKLLLALSTYGGDPNAGYRIARAAIHHYGSQNFKILIPYHCKSAGTLICIGAHSLVMADQAELGPLDIQLRKQDELFQQSSGLDILRGVTYLQSEALQSLQYYLLDINGGSGLSTKVASEIASNLVIGLYEPLFAQVDPIKLGEMNAALQIARHYGERLNEKSSSLKADALGRLIMGYPTHGFVIDRSEARTLFERVDAPSEKEIEVGKFSVWSFNQAGNSATVTDYNDTFAQRAEDRTPNDNAAVENQDHGAVNEAVEPVSPVANEPAQNDDDGEQHAVAGQ